VREAQRARCEAQGQQHARWAIAPSARIAAAAPRRAPRRGNDCSGALPRAEAVLRRQAFHRVVTRHPISFKRSPGSSEPGWFANPNLCSVRYSRMPAWSPVKGRPVRFAPCMPGARPTTRSFARRGPKAAPAARDNRDALSRLRRGTRQAAGSPAGGIESGLRNRFRHSGVYYRIAPFSGGNRIMAKVPATEIRVGHLLEWEKRIWRVLKSYHVHVGDAAAPSCRSR